MITNRQNSKNGFQAQNFPYFKVNAESRGKNFQKGILKVFIS